MVASDGPFATCSSDKRRSSIDFNCARMGARLQAGLPDGPGTAPVPVDVISELCAAASPVATKQTGHPVKETLGV
jgi:hypothetical protein